MKKERDLLPWILGGLSAAAIAVAYAAVSIHRVATTSPAHVAAATSLPVSSQPATPLQPGSAQPTTSQTPSAQTTSPADDRNAAPVSALAQTAGEPEVASNQIWECTTNGVKTFSNNPCGDKSTLLDVGPINTMRPTPAIDYARASGSQPHYAAAYPDQSAPADDYSDQYSADAGGNGYAVVGVVARRRPVQYHRPPVQPAPPAHHNPAPVRRN